MCSDMKSVFGDDDDTKAKGGLKQMGKSMDNGMVLVLSIWDDGAAHMLWLDSTYPIDKTGPGGPRGTCPTSSGVPSDVRRQHPYAHVIFDKISIGEIGSTYHHKPGPDSSGCPGGNLSACIELCQSEPHYKYEACVQSCH